MKIDWIQVLLDALSLAAAFAGAMFLRFVVALGTFDRWWYLVSFLTIVVLQIGIIYFSGGYELSGSESSSYGMAARSLAYAFAIYILVSYGIKNTALSRLVFLWAFVFAFALESLSRFARFRWQEKVYSQGRNLRKTLLIGGPSKLMAELEGRINSCHPDGLAIVEHLADTALSSQELVAQLTRLVDSGIVAVMLGTDATQSREVVEYCMQRYIDVYAVGGNDAIIFYPVDVLFAGGSVPILRVRRAFVVGSGLRVKRLLDFVLSLVGIIVLSPVFLVVALLVRLTSRGPIFFGHRRMGAGGSTIHVLKFRTMVVNAEQVLEHILQENPQLRAEWNKNFKLKNDPRITPIGSFLRKTSLDELPQLFNVLVGDLSLVGPRPIVRDEMDKYGDAAKYILRVPPGVTGLWQVSGRSDVDYAERVRLDMEYINNWSLTLDFSILFRTIPAVLSRKGSC
jgi:Undecaprenyl-phosphate galactose phosphotransferase WbaP